MLIKATVTSIPEYIMQCHKLPVKVCEEVNKLVRDFLWGSTVDKKKMHLVGWNKVTNPINLGGLGIFESKECNSFGEALLADCFQPGNAVGSNAHLQISHPASPEGKL